MNSETKAGLVAMVLEVAAQVVEKGWTRGEFARDADGEGVDFDDEKACSFCMLGALRRATLLMKEWDGYSASAVRMLAQDEIAKNMPELQRIDKRISLDFVVWNDKYAKDGAQVAAKLRETGMNLLIVKELLL
jgi:hypothetical protein